MLLASGSSLEDEPRGEGLRRGGGGVAPLLLLCHQHRCRRCWLTRCRHRSCYILPGVALVVLCALSLAPPLLSALLPAWAWVPTLVLAGLTPMIAALGDLCLARSLLQRPPLPLLDDDTLLRCARTCVEVRRKRRESLGRFELQSPKNNQHNTTPHTGLCALLGALAAGRARVAATLVMGGRKARGRRYAHACDRWRRLEVVSARNAGHCNAYGRGSVRCLAAMALFAARACRRQQPGAR